MALRTIETDDLKCLRPEGHGPWRLGDDLLLRTSMKQVPLRAEADAQAVFDVYRAARLAGASTPDALEVVRVADGYGVVVEYVAGLPLRTHLMLGSYSIEETGCAMAALARKLHAVHMEAGRDWGALFAQRAHGLSGLMPPQMGDRLVSLVGEVPPSNALIHGDLHMANVVVMDGECRPIDMEAAGFGHPSFDLGIARARLTGVANNLAAIAGVKRDVGERIWRRIWRAFLQGYFEGAGESALDDLDRRFEVLALIEVCRLLCANFHGDLGRLNEDQRKRLAASIQRLEEVLPHVERLDF